MMFDCLARNAPTPLKNVMLMPKLRVLTGPKIGSCNLALQPMIRLRPDAIWFFAELPDDSSVWRKYHIFICMYAILRARFKHKN